MRIEPSDKRKLAKIRAELQKTGSFRQMKNYIQHGNVTTYEHVTSVAGMSCVLNRCFHLHADEDALMRGALLHDFYLYDWHEKSLGKLHGFYHPGIACRNAIREYQIDEKTQNIICAHMWPMTITVLPKSREALIVSTADKLVSLNETLFRRGKKA